MRAIAEGSAATKAFYGEPGEPGDRAHSGIYNSFLIKSPGSAESASAASVRVARGIRIVLELQFHLKVSGVSRGDQRCNRRTLSLPVLSNKAVNDLSPKMKSLEFAPR
jgi:hypothetical protein